MASQGFMDALSRLRSRKGKPVEKREPLDPDNAEAAAAEIAPEDRDDEASGPLAPTLKKAPPRKKIEGKRVLAGLVKSRAASLKSKEPPLRLAIGHMTGVSAKDAFTYAVSYIQQHFKSLDDCWIYTRREDGGFYYELHQGGSGQAYLPKMLAALRNSRRSFVVQLHDRKTQVVFEDGGKDTYSLLLTHDDEAAVDEDIIPTTKMSPALGTGREFTVAGTITLVFGLILLVVGALVDSRSMMVRHGGADLEQMTVLKTLMLGGIENYDTVYKAIKLETRAEDTPLYAWNNQILGKPREPGEYIRALKYNPVKKEFFVEMGR